MKAAITDGKGKVWLGDVSMPEPGPHQCLCRMLACATCTGTDQKHIHDRLPWSQNYPGLLGHESIGRVISVGDRVRNFVEGELVLRPTPVYPGETLDGYSSLWGGFSEYGLITDTQALLEDDPSATPSGYARFQLSVPADLDIDAGDGTMLITLKETASYVNSVGVGLYSSLVILGAGSVAISMCRFAKVFGAYPVIVVGRRDGPLSYARDRIGADFVVNTSREDLVSSVLEATDGKGAEFLIDTTGDAYFMQACLPALSATGKAAAYATYKDGTVVKSTIPEDRLVTGVTGEDTAHQYLLDAVKLGLVDLRNYYSCRLPFDQIASGFEMLRKKREFKIVFDIAED